MFKFYCDKCISYEKSLLIFAQQISVSSNIKKFSQPKKTTKVFTVIRAPFVFKKSREQFGQAKTTIATNFTLQSNEQHRLLLQLLSVLKVPAELKTTYFN